jgi:hypothetical protein
MDQTDPPGEAEPPVPPPKTDTNTEPAPWSAFIEHLRHGHGIEDVPEDEVEAWRLHQKLHGR